MVTWTICSHWRPNSQKQTSLFWSSAKCGQDFSNLKAISSNFLYIWFNSQLPLMMSHKLGQHNFSEKCCFSSNEERALNLHPCHHPLLSGILIGRGWSSPLQPSCFLAASCSKTCSSLITAAACDELWHGRLPLNYPRLSRVNILPDFHTSVRNLHRSAKGWPKNDAF